MSNVVEFILKLKDMMSNGMQQAAVTARRTMDTAERATQRVTHANRIAGVGVATAARTTARHATRSIATLERALRMVERRRDISIDTREVGRANRAIDSLQHRIDRLRDDGGRSGGGLLSSFGSIRGIAATAGLAVGAMGLGSVVNSGMMAQQQKTSFQVMAGQQQGGKLFNGLTKFAQDSIFGNEVYQNAQTMKAFGIETQKIMPSLKMLGDISMGDKNKLGSLTLAFSQIQSTGRLMGQDLLQLVNAGFNPLKIISDKTGVSMADLKKKMEAGGISAKAVEMAFQAATGPGGQFYDMTNKIAQTDFGKLEALKGQVSGLAMQIGSALAPAIGNLITNYIAPFVTWLGKAVVWIQENSNWLGILVATIGTAFAAYKGFVIAEKALKALTAAQWLLNVAMDANPIGLIIGLIAALVAGVIYAWNHWKGFRDVITKTWETIKVFATLIKDLVINRIKDLINGISGLGKAIWLLFTGDFKKAFETGKQAVLDLTGVNTAKQAYEGAKNVGKVWTEGVADGITEQERLVQIAKMKALKGSGINSIIASAYKGFDTSNNWMMNIAKSVSLNKAKQDVEAASLKRELAAGNGTIKGSGRGLNASTVTSGGPRTITINVNKEMIGKLAINSYNVKEGVGEMENLIEEGLRRILYSAAAS